MWTVSLLKKNARFVLKGHLLYSILSVTIRILCSLLFFEQLIVSNLFPVLFSQTDIRRSASYYIILIVSVLLLLAARFLVINPVTVGLFRFFMEQRQGASSFSTIFSIFTAPSYWNVVKQLFLRDIQVFLLLLLVLVPGVYRHYQLRLVPWILAENPNLSVVETFSLSKTLVKEELLSLFVLDCSFLGWFLLSLVSFGIGFFFLLPYYYATLAECYATYRVKAFTLIDSSRSQLSGFLYR